MKAAAARLFIGVAKNPGSDEIVLIKKDLSQQTSAGGGEKCGEKGVCRIPVAHLVVTIKIRSSGVLC